MLIRFHGPFEKLAEKEVKVTVEKYIDVRSLLQHLTIIYPKLPFHDIGNPNTELNASIILVKNGAAVRLGDTLTDKDIIDVFIPVSGG
jgi:molybdopterin converting factor small subunit